MRRRRSTAGFSLIEILIALSLAGILVAGAFQLHAVFNGQARRQQNINDIQQSLRVSMQIIERAVRAAGMGMSNGKMLLPTGCTGARTFYRAQYYNSNVWPPPVVAGFDTVANNPDTDPDMLRLIAGVDPGSNLTQTSTGFVSSILGDTTTYQLGDVLLFMNTTTATAATANGCMRQITVAPPVAAGLPPTTVVTTDVGGSLCANVDPTCLTTVSYPTPVQHFRNQMFFRIQPPPAGTNEGPKLVLGTAPIGDPPANMTWNIIADDMEDMQIALLMADGRVCNSTDEPSPAAPGCDPSLATALRVTLTARTPMPVPGQPPSQTGGYEDMPAVATADGRIRRSITSEIVLRN